MLPTAQGHRSYESDCDCDPIDVEAFLIGQFIDIYYNKEIPCRTIVKELGRKVFESSDYQQLVQRLSSGFTYRNLVEKLSEYANGIDALTRVSIFLDRAIDYGMVVPITQIKDGIVSRAYRHGEDILFGEREEKLFAIMLRSFQISSRGDKPITHISAEKMMVLFTKIGVSLGVLDLYISNFTCTPLNRDKQKSNVLQIKPYLKGNVAIAGPVEALKKRYKIPFATDSDKALWLSELFLYKKKYLVRDMSGKYKLYNVIDSVRDSAIDQNSKDMSKRIGRLFGKVCNPEVNTGITFDDNDLVCISTCCSIKDAVLAITSELNIFKEEWNNSTDLMILKEKDFRTKAMCESVNSAYMKGRLFDEGKAWKLVDSVKFDNETEQEEWNRFFYELRYKAVERGERDRVYRAYNAGKYLSLQLLYSITLMDLAMLVRDYQGKKVGRYDVLWQRILAYHDELVEYHKSSKPGNFYVDINIIDSVLIDFKEWFDSGEWVWNSFDFDQCATRIYEYVTNNIIPECITFIELIEVMLGQSGKIHDLVPFKHVLCIAYSSSSDAESKSFNSIIRTEEDNIRSEKEKIIGLSELNDADSPNVGMTLDPTKPKLAWYVCLDDPDGDFALFASRVLYRLHLAGCSRFKMIYIGDLPFKNSIICRKESHTSLSCYGFYRFIDSLDEDIFTINDHNVKTITALIDSESNSFNPFIRRFDEERARKYYSVKTVGEKVIGKNTFTESCVEVKKEIFDRQTASYTSGLESDVLDSSDAKQYDIGIITVTPDEARTVIGAMDLKDNYSFRQRYYYEGNVAGKKVVMTQALDKGNTSIVSTFDELVNSYHPKFIFLLGVTEMKADSVDCCDVVVATSVYAYDFSRETDDGIQPRMIGLQSSSETKPIIQALNVLGEGVKASKGSLSPTFQIKTGPIASGSCSIETLKSKKKEMLSKVTDEILAIDTEGYGFYVAFDESKLSQNKVSGVFIVKGISIDDVNHENLYREPAAENAVAVVEKIIQLIPTDALC